MNTLSKTYTNIVFHNSFGGRGIIYTANRIDDPTETVLIKSVAYYPGLRIEDNKVPTEIATLGKLQHISGVCKLLDYCYNDSEYAIVMPYNSRAMDLFEYMKQYELTADQSIKIIKDVFEIVLKMQNAGYVHRDIKTENVIVDSDTLEVTLIDFDSADVFTTTTRSLIGTLFYYPPEAFINHECESEPMTVWSLGMLLFEMATYQAPFNKETEIISSTPVLIPTTVRNDIGILLGGMLQKDPRYRFTFEELINLL